MESRDAGRTQAERRFHEGFVFSFQMLYIDIKIYFNEKSQHRTFVNIIRYVLSFQQ